MNYKKNSVYITKTSLNALKILSLVLKLAIVLINCKNEL